MGKIRVGIFGAGRGMELAKSFMLLDTEIVALCDNHAGRREAALKRLDKGVAAYDNFDEFIEHPMDAVILANNFYQHAPYTIKCFEKKHSRFLRMHKQRYYGRGRGSCTRF
jgi:predicted dehydrogenase